MALIVGSNSYGSQAEADEYFSDSINNLIWSAFSATQKDQGIVTAVRLLEAQAWGGTKEVASQELAFPRVGLVDCEGNTVDAATSLEIASNGSFEYAIALLQNPALLSTTDTTGTNIKKVEAGSAKVTYFRPVRGSKYPLQVLTLLKCYFLGTSGASTGMSVSGNTDCSQFTNANSYGLNEGYK